MPGGSKKGGGLEVGSAYKMKGFSGFGNSPVKQKKTKYSKKQVLKPRYMYPATSTFEGSETSKKVQPLVSEKYTGIPTFTHMPASKTDPIVTEVKKRRKTISITKTPGGTEKVIEKKGLFGGKKRKEITTTTKYGKASTGISKTRYTKEGEQRGKTKYKTVKTRKKHAKHKKKHEKALEKIETKYVGREGY